MNTLSPRSEQRRLSTPLMWASGGTILIHGVFLVALWLWPKPPAKPHEQFLEVDLTKIKKVAVEPTARPTEAPKPTNAPKPTEVPKPTVAPKPTMASRPTAAPQPTLKPRVVVKPKLVSKTRLAQVIPTTSSLPTPTPPPVIKVVKPKSAPARKEIPTKNSTKGAPTAPDKVPRKNPPGSQKAGGNSLPPNPNPANLRPTGGNSGRLSARNNGPAEEPDNRKLPTSPSDSANKGSNSRGRSEETAGAVPGLELPRVPARRGRGTPSNSSQSSAPVRTADGTELNLGESSPGAAIGGNRRTARDFGNGDEEKGAPRTGGLANGAGAGNFGNSRNGRGADEAAGEGVGSGRSGSGALGNSRRGRGGARLAGDPFGTGGGNGGYGKGDGLGEGSGTGTGPGGTRLARRGKGRGTGAGDGDGDGNFGRIPGTGTGTAPGAGNGGGGRGGNSRGEGVGDEDSIGTALTGVGRGQRGRGTRRTGETEDELGRGIWGKFKLAYYQDKSKYPDGVDTRTLLGKGVDWPVFTGQPKFDTAQSLNFNWGEKPPVPGMKSTFWSMKAKAILFVPKEDNYSFFFDELDDAGRLFLDDKQIINVWQIQKSTPESTVVHLTRGKHSIEIQYVQGPRNAGEHRSFVEVNLFWQRAHWQVQRAGRRLD